MEIRISPEAEQDLIDIFDYILQDNPAAAGRVLDRIEKEILHLSRHPYLGKSGRVPKTRELIIADLPFIIPYQVTGTTLEILRVYHSARKWPDNFE